MQDTHTESHLATCKSFLKLILHEVLDKRTGKFVVKRVHD